MLSVVTIVNAPIILYSCGLMNKTSMMALVNSERRCTYWALTTKYYQ